MKYLLVFAILLASCRVTKPTTKDNSWNSYKDECQQENVQHYHWPFKLHIKDIYNRIPVEYGLLKLNNGDSINGLMSFFKIEPKFTDIIILPNGKKEETDLIKQFNSGVNHFVIFRDTNNTRCYLYFTSLYEQYNLPNFWRLVDQKNNIKIFDDFLFKDNWDSDISSIGKKNIVMTNGLSYIKVKFPRLFNSTKGSLKRFINKRYNANVHKKDFKTIRQMIDYILDKENEEQALNIK